MTNQLFHGMTWSALGIINKEMVSRALAQIVREIWLFEINTKANKYKADDLVTSADYAAQQIYVNLIQECTPNAGIIAEEHGLKKEPTHGEMIWYTIDPVDGTKALVRRQSDGIGTLFGVIDSLKNKVIASYIGDVMTQEIYYFRPWSDKVHRLNLRFPEKTNLLTYADKPKQRLLLLDDIRTFPEWAQQLTERWWYFDSMGISNGSIGTNMARLWKGEVDAVLLKGWINHPWDRVPCAGISGKMGYIVIEIKDNRIIRIVNAWDSRSMDSVVVPDRLIVHESKKDAILAKLAELGIQ